MSRKFKLLLVAISSFITMIQFQNCNRVSMATADMTSESLKGDGSNGQLGDDANLPDVPLVSCPQVLVQGNVEYIPVEILNNLVASQPEGSRLGFLNDLLNSCNTYGSTPASDDQNSAPANPDATQCVKVCHPENSPAGGSRDHGSCDGRSSDGGSHDDGSSDDGSSDDGSSDDGSHDDGSSDDNSSDDHDSHD